MLIAEERIIPDSLFVPNRINDLVDSNVEVNMPTKDGEESS